MISLIDKLNGIKATKIRWIESRIDISSPNEEGKTMKYMVLTLEEPIPQVVGSQTMYNPLTGNRIPLIAVDVQQVKVSFEAISKDQDGFNIKFKEDGTLEGSGSYEGDLLLDVSKGDDVWLTDVKLSKLSADGRKAANLKKVERLLNVGTKQ